MKSRVELSTFSTILTIAILVLIAIGLVATRSDNGKFITLSVIALTLLIPSMFYCPLNISADDDEVKIKSPFKIHSIPMSSIVQVERFQPTMGSIRVCASGGFLGYWGIFKEGDIGRYMAYYGKSSQCFLITLHNGDKYVLGCKNPDDMIDFIRTKIMKTKS